MSGSEHANVNKRENGSYVEVEGMSLLSIPRCVCVWLSGHYTHPQKG